MTHEQRSKTLRPYLDKRNAMNTTYKKCYLRKTGNIIHNIIIIGTKQYPYFIVTTNVVSDMAGLL